MVTMIVAVASYAVFRFKEKSKKPAAKVSAQPESFATSSVIGNPMLPTDALDLDLMLPNSGSKVNGNKEMVDLDLSGLTSPASPKPTALIAGAPQPTVLDPQIVVEKPPPPEEHEIATEEFEEEIEEDDEFLSPAQAAFLNSMQSTMGNGQEVKRKKDPGSTMKPKMRRFTVSNKKEGKLSNPDTDDEQSMWK